METSSPFDQAMARPLLDEPTRKKWRIGKRASSWFEKTAAMAVTLAANDDDDEVEDDASETISFLSKDKSLVESSSTTSNITDLAFSLDSISSYNYNNDNNSNKKSCGSLFLHSTQQHPLEVPAPHDVWKSTCSSTSSSSRHHPLALELELVQVDLECADTDLEILRERQAELTTIHSDMQQINSIQHGKKQCYRVSQFPNTTQLITCLLLSSFLDCCRPCWLGGF
jgi:hypothetical protein